MLLLYTLTITLPKRKPPCILKSEVNYTVRRGELPNSAAPFPISPRFSSGHTLVCWPSVQQESRLLWVTGARKASMTASHRSSSPVECLCLSCFIPIALSSCHPLSIQQAFTHCTRHWPEAATPRYALSSRKNTAC